jgi:alpha-glucosidase
MHIQHNSDTSISQEFYRWPLTTQAAQNAIDIRYVVPLWCRHPSINSMFFSYRLLDYIYTAFNDASVHGTTVVSPLWFKYPKDSATYPIDLQWLYGDSILVSPVTEEGSTSVSIYLPKDIFYDFLTLAPVQGTGAHVQLNNVSFTQIPVHIRGGTVLPLRAKSAMTTSELRETDFEFVVAPGTDGKAAGHLYIDDGVSVTQKATTQVAMSFARGTLVVAGHFGFRTGVKTARVRFLGVAKAPGNVRLDGKPVSRQKVVYNKATKVLDVAVGLDFTHGFTVSLV